jgi:hypothetical protein
MDATFNLTFTDQVNLTFTSDPGEPKTMKEALIVPESEKWIGSK